jgi:hypothetical protein
MRSILESPAVGGESNFDKSQIVQETAMIRYNKRLVMSMQELIAGIAEELLCQPREEGSTADLLDCTWG